MFDRNRVGDSTRLLDDGFIALLNNHFIDNADHLTCFGVVKRATAVTRISGGVKLEYVVRAMSRDRILFSKNWPESCGITIGVIAEIIPRWVTAFIPSTMPVG